MNVHAGFATQKVEVVFEPLVILPSLDEPADFFIERLDADFELERFLHLYAVNRGVLLTPFHNMALMCPDTTEADIDLHTKIFGDAARELVS